MPHPSVSRSTEGLHVAPLLGSIREQAPAADAERTVAPEVIGALKQSDVMRLSATRSIGGLGASVHEIGSELEAVAAACGSTGWVLWNHLCVFHFFCGLLGVPQRHQLENVVRSHGWCCLPAGAGTSVRAKRDGDAWCLSGEASFGSGARYSDFVGVPFLPEGADAPSFALVPTRADGVNVDANWYAMSLRASATDRLEYQSVSVSIADVAPFPLRYRDRFRGDDHPHVDPRYREDWVAISDLWLAYMAVGVAAAALDETCDGIRDRIAIMGVKIAERPTVHVNLGQAAARIAAARATIEDAAHRTDARIASGVAPDESDYLAQTGASMTTLSLCEEAMRLLLRVLGGNGLREGPAFERRFRDMQAMPLHINAHPDRVSEQLGRHRLGLDTENPF